MRMPLWLRDLSRRSLKNLFWYVFVATRGGPTRTRLMLQIIRNPSNARRLSEALQLDYTTIRHHLEVLERNGLVTSQGNKYNRIYFPSPLIEYNLDLFEEICEKIYNRADLREIRRRK